MSGLETCDAAGASAAGTLLGGYGEYRSGMDQAAAIDASRPYDLINAANKAQGLKYAADTALAGAQRQAMAPRTGQEPCAVAFARCCGGGRRRRRRHDRRQSRGADRAARRILQSAGDVWRTGSGNQLNYESQNALLEGVNTYNAKGVAGQPDASREQNAGGWDAAFQRRRGPHEISAPAPFGVPETDLLLRRRVEMGLRCSRNMRTEILARKRALAPAFIALAWVWVEGVFLIYDWED